MNKYLVCLIIVILVHSSLSFAYDNKKTHPSITEKAVDYADQSKIILQEQLGFSKDYDQQLNNGSETQTITQWLMDGSREEDEPLCRASNHFHDPLKDWDKSQLTDNRQASDIYCWATRKFYTKYSNISWATGIENPAGDFVPAHKRSFRPISASCSKNNARNIRNMPALIFLAILDLERKSLFMDRHKLMPEDVNGTGDDAVNVRNWFVARGLYYQALTATNPKLRELFFVETFHPFGYELHLLEDMTVPAHTRNFSEGHFNNIHLTTGKV